MIYIFRQYDSDKQIIIYAESYLEAKETLFEFNPWADRTYNIIEYKMYEIDINKFCKILNIDEEDSGYPRIISKKEFEKLIENKVILDSQFKNMFNTRILTKKDSSEKYPLLSTKEFLNVLQDNAQKSEKNKKNIYDMLNIVGDIWVKEFTVYNKNTNMNSKFYAYGKSRYQCNKVIDDLIKSTSDIDKIIYKRLDNNPKLLIENFYGALSSEDINKYNNMVMFMKENNIKKFPFTTYKNGESN